jgi:hypothetical protein
VYGPIFENHSEDTLRYPYKDYSSLNWWQAKRDLPYVRQGRNVSTIVRGDVNSGPVASMRGLLEAVTIVR